jgi:hypothetical protein
MKTRTRIVTPVMVSFILFGCEQSAPLSLQQAQFIHAVSAAQQAGSVRNELMQARARKERKQGICEVLGRNLTVSEWVGTLRRVELSMDGQGTVEVEIADGITVKTWNNAVSDALSNENTRVAPGGALYQSLQSINPGQRVAFSGSFVRNKTDCVEEASLTTSGSLSEPEFIFRFSSVSVAMNR